jgi:mRNA interferase RelE/StbE
MYRVRLLDAASKNLAGLDKPIARRIVKRIHWLAENIGDANLEVLTGDFEGLFKLRMGDYRIIYELIHEEQLIIIHTIGHRRDIYRKR